MTDPSAGSGSARASSRDDDRRVDELRQQLRSLGYLDAGVDRFVLAPAVRSRGPVVIALLASLRSGIIAGALLGPAAAIGIGGRLPGLVTGVRDAIVVALYLAILSGAAVAVLSFVAALVVSSIAHSSASGQRGRPLSTAAGVIISLACLAYLTLWWRTANAGFGWDAPVWTAFALVIAVAISLLIGHVVTLTARAVVVARSTAQTQQPRVPGVSWGLAVIAGMLAFVGAASLLVLTAESARSETPVPIAVRPSGSRVVVVALDGFDLNLYRQWRASSPAAILPFPLIDSGVAIPADRPRLVDPVGPKDHLGRVTVFEPSVAVLEPTDWRDPARLWTTIATARSPAAHGVEQLETRRVAGLRGRLTFGPVGRLLGGATDLLRLTRPAVASNVERQTKTFWEVAGQAGLRTSVTNWWATWPADTSAGTVISDRAVLRLEHGGVLDAEIAPAGLYEGLKIKWPELRASAIEKASTFFRHRALRELPPLPVELRTVLTRSAELDGFVAGLAEATDDRADLLALYLPGLDIAQHTLFGHEGTPPSEIDQRLTALRQYYDYVNSLIAETIVRLHPRDIVFLIAQPGRLHRGDGVFAAMGPGIQPTRTTATVLDVAPTILHSLGVPVARDLEGKVVQDLFEPEFLKRHPVRFVNSYGLKGIVPRSSTGQPLDAEAIERLRSLGYIK